jgi:hypothetical protein
MRHDQPFPVASWYLLSSDRFICYPRGINPRAGKPPHQRVGAHKQRLVRKYNASKWTPVVLLHWWSGLSQGAPLALYKQHD